MNPIIKKKLLKNMDNGNEGSSYNIISFIDNFTFKVDAHRITIKEGKQNFYFAHPRDATRHYSFKKKSTKITIKNVIYQIRVHNKFINRQTLDLYLEFDELDQCSDFMLNIISKGYEKA